MTPLSGLIPPLVTPLTDTGDVDVASLQRLVDFELAASATGVFVLGSSGEAIYLDDHARRQVVAATVEVVDGRVPVLAGALEASPSGFGLRSR